MEICWPTKFHRNIKRLKYEYQKHTSNTFHTLECAKKVLCTTIIFWNWWMNLLNMYIYNINLGDLHPTTRHFECRTNLFLYFIFIIIHIYTYIKSFILYMIIINSCFTWNTITLVTSKRFRKRIWFSVWSLRGQWNKKMWENQIHAVLARYTFQDE